MQPVDLKETNYETVQTFDIDLWAIRIICLSFIAQIYLSLNLWFPMDRSYPTVPAIEGMDFELGQSFTFIFSGLFLLGLILASLVPNIRKVALGSALFCLGILILEDINRFQAWVYIYLALLSVIFWDYTQTKNHRRVLVTLQFIMAMVYFWTGAQKLNVQFITDVYPWLVKIFDITEPLKNYPNVGYGIGLGEMLIGVCLLYKRTVRIGVLLGTLLHIGILVLLVSDQWNSVVYPWNIAMIALLWTLFAQIDEHETPFIFSNDRPNLFFLFLFGLVPLMDFFNLGPHNLALGMYSGTSLECDIIMKDHAAGKCLPKKLQKELIYHSKDESDLSLDDWAVLDMNVPPFASPRVYKAVASKVCACIYPYEGSHIELYQPYRWKDEDHYDTLTCRDLLRYVD